MSAAPLPHLVAEARSRLLNYQNQLRSALRGAPNLPAVDHIKRLIADAEGEVGVLVGLGAVDEVVG